MYVVSRNLVVLKPTTQFLRWLKNLPDPTDELTLDELHQDCTALLIPEVSNQVEARLYIEHIYLHLFEMELESWCRDASLWPQQRDLQTFREWIHLEVHSEVVDLLPDDLEKEDFEW